jgi:hypothetical protein
VFIAIRHDTVFVEKYKTNVFYRIKTDTIMQRDSIRFEHKIYVDREIELSWFKKMQIYCSWAFGIILLILIFWKIIKSTLKIKNYGK